jgi:hypothetical protein
MADIMRFTRRSLAACWKVGLAAGLAICLAGCATCQKYSLTYRLWDSGDFGKFNEPAPDPKLGLFEATNHADVLVQYDAFTEKHSAVKRQAYYLRANHARIINRQKPKFVRSSKAEGMKPIPIVGANAGMTNAPVPDSAYAVTGVVSRTFTLYQQGGRAETFDLPIFQESSGTAIRAAFTPLAVAGDTAMVAGAAAFVFLEALASSHSTFTVH